MNGAHIGAEVGLFKADDRSGARWLFLVSERGWAVTCNGRRILAGGLHARSLDAGLRKFQALARDLHGQYRTDALMPLAS